MKTLFFLIIFSSLLSCSKNAEINGTWELEKMDYSEFIKSTPKQMRGNMKKILDKQTKEFINHTFFEFRKDKTLELSYPNEFKMTIKGTYSFSKNLDSVFLEKDDPESFKIVELTEKNLVLKTSTIPQRSLTFRRKK